MLFLQIPAQILRSKKLTGDEKILLSYIVSLNRQGAAFFGSPEYLEEALGIKDPVRVLHSLEETQKTVEGNFYRMALIENLQGKWHCRPEFWELISEDLKWNR